MSEMAAVKRWIVCGAFLMTLIGGIAAYKLPEYLCAETVGEMSAAEHRRLCGDITIMYPEHPSWDGVHR